MSTANYLQFKVTDKNYNVEPAIVDDVLNGSISTVTSFDSSEENATVESQINVAEEDSFLYVAG